MKCAEQKSIPRDNGERRSGIPARNPFLLLRSIDDYRMLQLHRIPRRHRRTMNNRGRSFEWNKAVANISGSSHCSDVSAAGTADRGCLCCNDRHSGGNQADRLRRETICCNNHRGRTNG